MNYIVGGILVVASTLMGAATLAEQSIHVIEDSYGIQVCESDGSARLFVWRREERGEERLLIPENVIVSQHERGRFIIFRGEVHEISGRNYAIYRGGNVFRGACADITSAVNMIAAKAIPLACKEHAATASALEGRVRRLESGLREARNSFIAKAIEAANLRKEIDNLGAECDRIARESVQDEIEVLKSRLSAEISSRQSLEESNKRLQEVLDERARLLEKAVSEISLKDKEIQRLRAILK